MEIEKELPEIAWKVDEPTYRADPALSYSTLAKYEKVGFDNLDTLFKSISTPSLILGSLVDIMITGTPEELEQSYFVTDIPALGEKEQQITECLLKYFADTYSTMQEIPYNTLLTTIKAFEFQNNWKEETRVRVILERCAQYYGLKRQVKEKTVITQETYNAAVNAARTLREAPVTSKYFADNDPLSPVRRYYQLKFKFSHEGVDYRSMLDLVVVNYETKTIYPIDLKTSGKFEWHFEDSFCEWMYMIQARLYWRNLRSNLDKDPYFKDFKLADYRFIVINKKKLTPLVWEFPLTQTMGTLIDNNGNEYRDPFEIGKELQGYLNFMPQVPNHIKLYGLNTINCLKRKNIN